MSPESSIPEPWNIHQEVLLLEVGQFCRPSIRNFYRIERYRAEGGRRVRDFGLRCFGGTGWGQFEFRTFVLQLLIGITSR